MGKFQLFLENIQQFPPKKRDLDDDGSSPVHPYKCLHVHNKFYMLLFSHANSVGSNESRRQEAAVLQWNVVNGEKHKEVDSRESVACDGVPLGSDTYNQHRGSLDKHRFTTMGYQVSH